MNKNYIFILIAVAAIVLVAVAYSMTATMTLDQIIKNKDCVALDKWDNERMFDNNLDISSEQMSAAMKLAMECVGIGLDNMLGSSDSMIDPTDPMVIIEKILKEKNCTGLEEWEKDHPGSLIGGGMTEITLTQIYLLSKECNNK